MIVKIFKAATSFTGVNYNERKNENGRSELLAAENFAINSRNPKKEDYIAYMEAVCNTNKNVRNKQFHATISCKGREYSVDELKDIAEQYIKKMGYGNNPYLIYFHSDTNNNHVHIVSTRVDKQGKRMNDKMEAIRSHKILNEIMNVDISIKAKEDIRKYLDYSFSSIQQYKLLLERSGWKLGEKGDNIELYKSGVKQGVIAKEEITKHADNYQSNKERQKQIAAILRKYKKGLGTKELQVLMKDKFGLDIVFHTGKGHVVPYGYTIIDNSYKSVYKGSEVLDLKELLGNPEREDKVKELPGIIHSILENESKKYTLEEFQKSLAQYGYKFSPQRGTITLKGERKPIHALDKQTFEELKYNSRVKIANEYKISSKEEAELIAKLYSINVSDVTINKEKKDVLAIYSDLMKAYLLNSNDIRTSFENNGYSFFTVNSNIYLVDKNEKVIVNTSELNIELDELIRSNQPVTINKGSDIDRVREELLSEPDYSRGENAIDILCDILSYHSSNIQDESQRRKKKRGQQQQ